MGCILISALLFSPRILLFVLWLVNFFAEARPWETKLWPILGFLFMPWTTIMFGLGHVYNGGEFTGMWLIGMILAVIFDLGSNGSTTTASSS